MSFNRIKTTLAGGMVFALALVAQEFAVRLTLPQFDPGTHLKFAPAKEDLPPLGAPFSAHRLVKNSGDYDVEIRFNKFGLRDSKILTDATGEDYFVVGDSFAFGWGVEEADRFSNRLQDIIGAKVFNLGAPANIAGYEQLLAMAQRLGVHPRRVILAINLSDDFVPMPAAQPARRKPGKAAATGPSLSAVKEFMLSHSSLYFLATSIIQRTDWLRRKGIEWGLILPLNLIRNLVPGDASIAATADRLAAIADRFETIFLIIPDRGVWIGGDQSARREAHDKFVAALGRRGLNFVDMRAHLEAGGNPMAMLFRTDAHWLPAGHKLAARVLARRIREAR